MRTVSLSEVLDGLFTAARREKTAKINMDSKTFFVHVDVPVPLAEELRAVQRRVIPNPAQRADIDHVTLVYTRKPTEDHPPEKVHTALAGLQQVGEQTSPIHAKVQGWGYFDGASKGGKTNTALVALLDAPGLEHLHVDMSRALKVHGIDPSDTHVFTPHITLGYLGEHGRTDTPLPAIAGRFTIDKVHVAARDRHVIPLNAQAKTATLGVQAAKFAARAGMRQITNALSAGETALAHRLATTPGVLKPSAAGSQIRHLGSGMEGTSTLVAHPQHGIAVRKVYDPQGISGPEMVARKAQAGAALQGNPNVAQFRGETPTQIGPAHFYEHVPGVSAPSARGTPSSAEVASQVRSQGAGSMRLHDVHEGNVVNGKVVDYLPVQPGAPTGLRTDVMARAEAASDAHRLGVNHAFTNYIKDPARPGNLMGQAFRGAAPLVQGQSPPQNSKWASLEVVVPNIYRTRGY